MQTDAFYSVIILEDGYLTRPNKDQFIHRFVLEINIFMDKNKSFIIKKVQEKMKTVCVSIYFTSNFRQTQIIDKYFDSLHFHAEI